jgi:hypothetical protein
MGVSDELVMVCLPEQENKAGRWGWKMRRDNGQSSEARIIADFHVNS